MSRMPRNIRGNKHRKTRRLSKNLAKSLSKYLSIKCPLPEFEALDCVGCPNDLGHSCIYFENYYKEN